MLRLPIARQRSTLAPLMDQQPQVLIAAALLRVTMGTLFLAHVCLRLTVITWPVAEQFFMSLGLPRFMAYVVTITEAVVGLLLITGWQVRKASLAGAVVLLFATLLVHIQNGFLFTNAGGGWEYPAFWFVALVCQSLLGSGSWSLKSAASAFLASAAAVTPHQKKE